MELQTFDLVSNRTSRRVRLGIIRFVIVALAVASHARAAVITGSPSSSTDANYETSTVTTSLASSTESKPTLETVTVAPETVTPASSCRFPF